MIQKINRVIKLAKTHGIGYLFNRAYGKLVHVKIPEYNLVTSLFKGKSGLEVGGPSGIFKDKGFIPLYKIIDGLDGCNFSATTIWEGNIEGGETYDYDTTKQKGTQYISEATDLSLIPDSAYEFVISSNCLEHVANPMKALKEWIRVTQNGGLLLLVLPRREYCFDHKRPITKLQHLLDDLQNDTKEDDLTHLDEVLALHDLSMDPPAGNPEQFKKRSLDNYKNRALHHHIFDVALLKEMFEFFGLEILLTHEGTEHIILGRKK